MGSLDLPQTFVQMLAAWRQRRSRELAAAIVELNQHLPREHGYVVMSDLDEPYQVKWQLERAPDPRASSLVAAALRDLHPSRKGHDSDELWLRCAEALVQLDDPVLLDLRTAERLHAHAPNVPGLMQRLEASLAVLTKHYPKGPPPIDPADQRLIDHARALLRERTREQDLLAQVYAAPHLDEPRLVYADWLLERGDVYGELIQLQIQAERGPLKKPARARLDQLLGRDGGMHFMKVLRPVITSGSMRRGFPFSANVEWRHWGQRRELGSHPAWATVEEVFLVRPKHDVSPPPFLDVSVMTSLRQLLGVEGPDLLEMLCAAPKPWPLQILGVMLGRAGGRVLVEHLRLFPNLRELRVRALDENMIDWVWSDVLGSQIERLVLFGQKSANPWSFRAPASELSSLQRLDWYTPGLLISLTRAPDGGLTEAVFAGVDVDAIVKAVSTAPRYAVTRVEVPAELGDKQLRQLERTLVRRHGPVDFAVRTKPPEKSC